MRGPKWADSPIPPSDRKQLLNLKMENIKEKVLDKTIFHFLSHKHKFIILSPSPLIIFHMDVVQPEINDKNRKEVLSVLFVDVENTWVQRQGRWIQWKFPKSQRSLSTLKVR